MEGPGLWEAIVQLLVEREQIHVVHGNVVCAVAALQEAHIDERCPIEPAREKTMLGRGSELHHQPRSSPGCAENFFRVTTQPCRHCPLCLLHNVYGALTPRQTVQSHSGRKSVENQILFSWTLQWEGARRSQTGQEEAGGGGGQLFSTGLSAQPGWHFKLEPEGLIIWKLETGPHTEESNCQDHQEQTPGGH